MHALSAMDPVWTPKTSPQKYRRNLLTEFSSVAIQVA
jgi:hypothetical protein